MADPLYRGEAAWYPSTHSAWERMTGMRYLFDPNNKFNIGEATFLKIYFKDILNEILLKHFEGWAPDDDDDDAPSSLEIGEAIYGLLQHYHIPTNFIDLTTDIDIATAFAIEGWACLQKGQLKNGQLFVVDRRQFVVEGGYFIDNAHGVSKRPRIQSAVPFFVPAGLDFQQLPERVVRKVKFSATPDECERYARPEIYDASDDDAAHMVASIISKHATRAPAFAEFDGAVLVHLRQIVERFEQAGVNMNAEEA